jgi:hypothetical protein
VLMIRLHLYRPADTPIVAGLVGSAAMSSSPVVPIRRPRSSRMPWACGSEEPAEPLNYQCSGGDPRPLILGLAFWQLPSNTQLIVGIRPKYRQTCRTEWNEQQSNATLMAFRTVGELLACARCRWQRRAGISEADTLWALYGALRPLTPH